MFASRAPLFEGGHAEERERGAGELPEATIVHADLVSGGRQAVVVGSDGVAYAIEVETGRVWGSVRLIGEGTATAVSFEAGTRRYVVGLADGSIQRGEVACEATPISEDEVPEGVTLSEDGRVAALDAERSATLAREVRAGEATERAGAVARTAAGPVLWDLRVVRGAASRIAENGAAVVGVSGVQVSDRERRYATLHEDGSVYFTQVRTTRSLGGGAGRDRATVAKVETDFAERGRPSGVYLLSGGTHLLAVWDDGRCERFAAGDDGQLTRVSTVALEHGGAKVTAVRAALGSSSLLVGDEAGVLASWTPLQTGTSDTRDGVRLTRKAELHVGDAPITAIGVGERDRTVAVGLADGSVVIANVTSRKTVASWSGADAGGAVIATAVEPAVSRVLAASTGGAYRAWALEPGHPEASWSSLFGRVQYEGYAKPAWVYQSTGSPGSEAKLSLVPLVWGTLKATIVAMLFAVPVAVLGAIYTSEFLHPDWRKAVKPTIELMASLPSVVLGFIAAMLVAPYVRDWLPGVLVGFGVVPATVIVGAGVWRMVPTRVTRAAPTWVLALLILAALAVGVGISSGAGHVVERVLFAQAVDIRSWLDGGAGGAWPGWVLVMIAPAALVVLVGWSRFGAPAWNDAAERMGRTSAAGGQLALLIGQLVATVVVACVLAWGVSAAGLDARDSIFGPFSQRNTLVVGLIMGIAVIPIIYTISEDALNAVPRGLRFASLGCGATAWQTAVRVVLPVAGSGIFSACMVGLGRAVGETMIVLMATGNTPEMTGNIFGGFRTLAANIAVELPEAPRASTHYHVLFLCGLVLFLMTLAINTTAELVRQRFRRRNAAL
ncbi:MAG: ABC transporter permease subunit [Phycisphaerales bacterium]